MSSPSYKISSKSTYHLKICTHLRSLNVCHFGMVEAKGLKKVASRSSSFSSPPYNISFKSTNRLKSYYGVSLQPHKFKHPPFWSGKSTDGFKSYGGGGQIDMSAILQDCFHF
jgi:hypothetical protein